MEHRSFKYHPTIGGPSARACSSTRPHWFKEGVSEFDTANFESECKFQTGLAKIKGDQADELVKLCMQGKGFRLR